MLSLNTSDQKFKLSFTALCEWTQTSPKCSILLIYLALLIDNLLLTSIVPVIPDYLNKLENGGNRSPIIANLPIFSVISSNNSYYRVNNMTINYNPGMLMHSGSSFGKENGDIGLLLSSKAFVQLICNSFVSAIISKFGYGMTQIFGSTIILLSSLLYSFGESFSLLLLSRCIQGIASSLITVSGMAMIASMYTNERDRCSSMGFVMGGMAVGVLVGYPFGSFTYDFIGKSATFGVIAFIAIILLFFQFITFNWSSGNIHYVNDISFAKLLYDKYVLLAIGTITISTTSMSLLESCLPLWLIEKMNPPKWQLGAVFIPDSIGYFIGTNFCAALVYKQRWLTAFMSLALVGLSAIIIPIATNINQLIIPHFGLGLGIGITDAVIMPLLAYLVDVKYFTSYGTVYAVAQMAVCLAYSLGPLIGGQLIKLGVGFPAVIRSVGFINLLFCPFCLLLRNLDPESSGNEEEEKKRVFLPNNVNVGNINAYNSTQQRYVPFIDED